MRLRAAVRDASTMAYQVTLTFLTEAESEEALERYVDGLAYEIAQREGFYLENRTIDEVAVHLPGSFRTVGNGDLPSGGR